MVRTQKEITKYCSSTFQSGIIFVFAFYRHLKSVRKMCVFLPARGDGSSGGLTLLKVVKGPCKYGEKTHDVQHGR